LDGAEEEVVDGLHLHHLEVQVHHLISLGGWNDVIHLSIYPSTNAVSLGNLDEWPVTRRLEVGIPDIVPDVFGESVLTIKLRGYGSRRTVVK
jgi:hypothetical protein